MKFGNAGPEVHAFDFIAWHHAVSCLHTGQVEGILKDLQFVFKLLFWLHTSAQPLQKMIQIHGPQCLGLDLNVPIHKWGEKDLAQVGDQPSWEGEHTKHQRQRVGHGPQPKVGRGVKERLGHELSQNEDH